MGKLLKPMALKDTLDTGIQGRSQLNSLDDRCSLCLMAWYEDLREYVKVILFMFNMYVFSKGKCKYI